MKVIYNNIIPFGKYIAINLFGVVFAKRKVKYYSEEVKNIIWNHEKIHTE